MEDPAAAVVMVILDGNLRCEAMGGYPVKVVRKPVSTR